MKTTRIALFIAMQLALFVTCVFGEADYLPIFEYKGTYKAYDPDLFKIVSGKYAAYFVYNGSSSYEVWYWASGKNKWYEVYKNSPINITLLDDIGNIEFTYGVSDLGFGKMTRSAINGSMMSCSATGTIADFDSEETGTFSLRYNGTLTKKAISQNISALTVVITDLIAKKYVLYQ